MVNGMNTSSAQRRASSAAVSASLVGRGDVEEHDLVGALVLIAGGELDGVPGVPDVHEVGALDHAALVHVEAGDDALEQHQLGAVASGREGGDSSSARASITLKRPS